MAERYTYTPEEIVDAANYVAQQIGTLRAQVHAYNWRQKFPYFIDEMTLRFEGLKLLTSLLNGNTNVNCGDWFEETAQGSPPPMPDNNYDLMALGWQQVCTAVRKQGEGFFVTGKAIDLPYVLTCGFQGGSLGEKFVVWAEAYLEPFLAHFEGWIQRITKAMPAKGTFDLWDLALEVVNKGGAAEPGESLVIAGSAKADEGEEAADAPEPKAKKAAKKAAKKTKKTKKKSTTKKKTAKKSTKKTAKKGTKKTAKKTAKKGTKKGRPTGASKKSTKPASKKAGRDL